MTRVAACFRVGPDPENDDVKYNKEHSDVPVGDRLGVQERARQVPDRNW